MTENVVAGLRDLLYDPQAQAEFGGPAVAPSEVYGALVEIGYRGTVIVIAGFKDGTSRLYLGTGGGVMGMKEDFPPQSHEAARLLVKTAQQTSASMSPERSRAFPQQGQVRIAALTGGGALSATETIERLEAKQSPFAPIWGPTNYLMNILLQFMSNRAPPRARP
jgi:hypothetical protein